MVFYQNNRKVINTDAESTGEYDDRVSQIQTKETDSERNGPGPWLNLQNRLLALIYP